MDNIIGPNSNFDFSKLSLAQPIAIQGGAHFTKILMNGQPLYVQSPKCTTRQGFIKTGKKIHSDLMFNNNDGEFIHWLENLETKCQELIYQKSNEWFQSPLEMVDIETAFNPPLKVYKSGKFYLVRTNVKINSLTNQPLIKIYNENESPVLMDDIISETNIITILEIQGIKFTTRNFQIDIELKQVMVLNKDIIFESCLIKKTSYPVTSNITTSSNPITDLLPPKEDINISNDLEDAGESPLVVEDNISNKEDDIFKLEDIGVTNDIVDEIETETEADTEAEKEEETADNTLKEADLVDSILESMDEPANELTEFNINLDLDNNSGDAIELKKPDKVYYEMYQNVREKAKKAKQEAMLAYLEAKNIKKTYLLENLSDSSEESLGGLSDIEDD